MDLLFIEYVLVQQYAFSFFQLILFTQHSIFFLYLQIQQLNTLIPFVYASFFLNFQALNCLKSLSIYLSLSFLNLLFCLLILCRILIANSSLKKEIFDYLKCCIFIELQKYLQFFSALTKINFVEQIYHIFICNGQSIIFENQF